MVDPVYLAQERWRRGREQPEPEQPFGEYFPSSMTGPPPPPRWMVDTLIMRKTLGIISGPGGIGKSLLLQQLMSAAACGKDWLGYAAEDGLSCFSMFGEDDNEVLQRRQIDINQHYGISPEDLDLNFAWRPKTKGDSTLIRFEHFSDKPIFTPLWKQTWDFVREYQYNFVGFDTARVVFGGKEIDPRQVTVFCRELAEKAEDIDGAVILNAHPAKAGSGPSGTTAWGNSPRWAFDFGRPDEYDAKTGARIDDRVLSCIKSNYAPFLPLALRYQNGVFVSDRPAPHIPRRRIDLDDLDLRMLDGLSYARVNGAWISSDVLDRRSLPRRARERSEDLQYVPMNYLYESQDRLIKNRLILRVWIKGRGWLRRPSDKPYQGEEENTGEKRL